MACLLLSGWISPLRGEAIDLPQPDNSQLTLPQPTTRVITLAPHLAELVHVAGAGETLLASVEYSDYPPAVAELPRIGDAFRIDVERILDLRPDLIISWESGNPPAAINQLRSLGLSVWEVEIREPDEIAQSLIWIGLATGSQKIANAAAEDFRTRLASLARQYENVPSKPYFYQADDMPLFTLAGDHLVSKGLALCGGENIFADLSGLALQVSHEAVLAANPEAILAPYIEGRPPPLEHWNRWQDLTAVRNQALFLLPADQVSRATPRWLDSMDLACNLLHQSVK